jgi:hypothetical protein
VQCCGENTVPSRYPVCWGKAQAAAALNEGVSAHLGKKAQVRCTPVLAWVCADHSSSSGITASTPVLRAPGVRPQAPCPPPAQTRAQPVASLQEEGWIAAGCGAAPGCLAFAAASDKGDVIGFGHCGSSSVPLAPTPSSDPSVAGQVRFGGVFVVVATAAFKRAASPTCRSRMRTASSPKLLSTRHMPASTLQHT